MLLSAWFTASDSATWNDVVMEVLGPEASARDFREASDDLRAARHLVAAAPRMVTPGLLAFERSRDHRVWVHLAPEGVGVLEIVGLRQEGPQWVARLRDPLNARPESELSWNAFVSGIDATLVTR